MIKSLKAYWNLRKFYILGVYICIILVGVIGMITDQSNWNSYRENVYNYTNEKDYHTFKSQVEELVKNGHGKDDYHSIDFFSSQFSETGSPKEVNSDKVWSYDYVAASTFGKSSYVNEHNLNTSELKNRLSAKNVLQYLPNSFEEYRNKLLNFYNPTPEYNNGFIFGPENSTYFFVSINNSAIMSFVLIIAPLLLLIMCLDQGRKFSLFYVQRGRNRNKLLFSQFIYFALGSILMITLMSIITHMTRGLFIPNKYVNIPVRGLIENGKQIVALALILTIFIMFIDALIGKSIYKILTTVFSIPAIILFVNNLSSKYRGDLDKYLSNFKFIITLIILSVIIIPIIYFMNLKYSSEQDERFIRLKKLSIPFYLFIVFLTTFDLFMPSVTSSSFSTNNLIYIIIGIFVIVLFGKLILNFDSYLIFKRKNK
ncbi:hypothetical protein BG261_00420 [Floricoccus tropicus]|uniref:Uncharacterized protein n=1 Tax=Floricoccus tropicus TaxID=1859473 RepID=A0A1E8GQ73_9LACT|nr:hypothetical protein [Floricoccus tropicus]OFI50385.1 hypothetical protein BG261_00420 [Floricoccus tropicus]